MEVNPDGWAEVLFLVSFVGLFAISLSKFGWSEKWMFGAYLVSLLGQLLAIWLSFKPDLVMFFLCFMTFAFFILSGINLREEILAARKKKSQ